MRDRADIDEVLSVHVRQGGRVPRLMLQPDQRVALIQAFAGGLRNLGKMDEFVMAAMVAESRLAEVGILYPVAVGEMEGVEEGDKYHWRISVAPFEDPDGLTLMPEQTPNLYLVEVDVNWDSGRKPGSFRLESLRVGP